MFIIEVIKMVLYLSQIWFYDFFFFFNSQHVNFNCYYTQRDKIFWIYKKYKEEIDVEQI